MAPTDGKRMRKRSHTFDTRPAGVCWSITSDTQVLHGPRRSRHGRARPCCRYHGISSSTGQRVVDVVLDDDELEGVVVVVIDGALPTVMVTVSPFLASAPAVGSCLITLPTWLGVVVTASATSTTNPAASRLLVASSWVWPTTLGTLIVSGPCETTSVTLLPLSTSVPGGGSLLMTTPSFTLGLNSSRRSTWRPTSLSWRAAVKAS